ncbi:hypothetical protein K1T71_000040 [Dendrolimus kikuchii]|uniref:Uncharacterized protein n=1 Tax=Dendrolimus kikuchii TaxID=765133 RepID=A0ACC1DI95_9NEOP|nr:hypothetical protein K1T71_000040 [Dendrolimus kikuchii]
MFMQPPDEVPGKLDDGFSRPVESIMMCEEFKSNFARRLSNRYTSRPVMSGRQDNTLKLRPIDICLQDCAPETMKRCPQLKKGFVEQNDQVKAPDKNMDIRNTEVSALKMEVETLRWQLAQTEANRQMHIALLKQIVSFLSRVKEHIECQNFDSKDRARANNLPRSLSVAHVNKNVDFQLSPVKKINAKKISKSISNVNGYKDSGVWSQSKLSLIPEIDASQKITEEMSRLITLASTVLSTKLPDLACNCIETMTTKSDVIAENELNDSDNDFILNKVCNSEDFNGNSIVKDFIPLNCRLENDFPSIKTDQKPKVETKPSVDKGFVALIEDESGFSSMSSFQEIGIPIISIISPSPCKEVACMDGINDLLDETDKWKNDSNGIDKNLKVFWV